MYENRNRKIIGTLAKHKADPAPVLSKEERARESAIDFLDEMFEEEKERKTSFTAVGHRYER